MSTDTSKDLDRFLSDVSVPELNYEDAKIREGDLDQLELLKALMSVQNNKYPGNEGSKRKKELSTSWRQAVIKLIEKKGRDKQLIKNGRPISLINIDYKIISEALAIRSKETLS